MRLWLAVLIAACLSTGTGAQAGRPFDPQPGVFTSVRAFIGVWESTETLYAGTDREHVERSRRVCEAGVADMYVVCHSQSSSDRGEREYVWLMNEPEPGFIEWISVFSNYPGKGLFRGRILDDGTGVDMQSFEIGEERLEPGSFQRIRFSSEDEYEWEVGLSAADAPYNSGFALERAVRVSGEGSDGR